MASCYFVPTFPFLSPLFLSAYTNSEAERNGWHLLLPELLQLKMQLRTLGPYFLFLHFEVSDSKYPDLLTIIWLVKEKPCLPQDDCPRSHLFLREKQAEMEGKTRQGRVGLLKTKQIKPLLIYVTNSLNWTMSIS